MKYPIIILFVALFFGCSQPNPVDNKVADELTLTVTSQIADTFLYITYMDSTHARAIKALNDSTILVGSANAMLWKIQLGNETMSISTAVLDSKLEVRDIMAIGDKGIAMMSGDDGEIFNFSLNDFKPTKQLLSKDLFLDAFDFTPSGKGVMFGDPVDGQFSIFTTTDFGTTWQKLATAPKASSDREFGYAASGSLIQMLDEQSFVFVTGGEVSRFFRTDDFGQTFTSSNIPMQKGEGAGAFSTYFWNEYNGVVVGGNYTNPTNLDSLAVYTVDGGKSWKPARSMPAGYRSVVKGDDNGRILISAGRNGIDYSTDFGENWKPFSSIPFYTCDFSRNYVWFSGKNGKIARVDKDWFFK